MTDRMKDAAQGLLNHLREQQALMRAYLKPDSGITAEQFADDIIATLDGPKQRGRQSAAEAAIASTNTHSTGGSRTPV